MNHLDVRQTLQESQLDQGLYFQSLFLEACKTNLLSPKEIERLQLELVELMGKEVERYTNDESSSIPVEKAQEILQSITYSIGYFLKSTTDMTQKLDMLKTEKIIELYHKGMNRVAVCKKEAEQLLANIQLNAKKLNNYAYQDTIFAGFSTFFHDYNIEFGAHETPGSIDYPLFDTITSITGVEFIYEYLRRLNIEQGFLLTFSEQSINNLLNNFDTEAEHMLINIYELVLCNSLGCVLLGKEASELEIRQDEICLLQKRLENSTITEISDKLVFNFHNLQDELKMEQEILSYSLAAILKMAYRFHYNIQSNTLDKLLIITKEDTFEETFVDGTPMEDEKLRLLIEKLSDISITSEKIAIIKDTVRSQADFIELMEVCFYEDEYKEVFDSLNEAEKTILKKGILLGTGQSNVEDLDSLKEWQRLLFQIK